MALSTDLIKAKARELGFNLIGMTRAVPSPTLVAYRRWIEAGMHGRMGYMARPDRVSRREDLSIIVPDAQTIIMVGLDYRTVTIPDEVLNDPTRGRIASYARGLDYHDVMTPRLESLAAWLSSESSGKISQRVYVDTGAVLERSHAQQAGMGFIGKNTLLIHPRRGSYFFLGEIITSLELDSYDQPHRPTMCGTCTRCLAACPTDAFPRPYVLDARRCISYHTIENKGWIDRDLSRDFDNWIFGCDICQDVCPFQRFSLTTAERVFFPVDIDRVAPPLMDILLLTDSAFRERYANTPLYRIRRHRLVRNACIAAGNSGDAMFIPVLIQLLYDELALVRGHAARALWQIMGDDSRRLLMDLYDRDEDQRVKNEVAAWLT